jgi:hypothetical protein
MANSVCWVDGTDSSLLRVNIQMLLSRLSPADEEEILGVGQPRSHIVLRRPSSLGPRATMPAVYNPARAQALTVQLFGEDMEFEDACNYCSQGGQTDPTFLYWTTLGTIGGGACGCCLWNHQAARCSHRKWESRIP